MTPGIVAVNNVAELPGISLSWLPTAHVLSSKTEPHAASRHYTPTRMLSLHEHCTSACGCAQLHLQNAVQHCTKVRCIFQVFNNCFASDMHPLGTTLSASCHIARVHQPVVAYGFSRSAPGVIWLQDIIAAVSVAF